MVMVGEVLLGGDVDSGDMVGFSFLEEGGQMKERGFLFHNLGSVLGFY